MITVKLSKFNGWLRLYIVAVALWVSFATYNLFLNLPSRPEISTLESRALFELTSEIKRIQNISPMEERYKYSDSICEAANLKSNINKNECMEFMINPKPGDLTSEAVMEVRIASSNIKERALQAKKDNDDRFNSTLTELTPGYLRQIIILPLILFVLGHIVAWIRRGFILGK